MFNHQTELSKLIPISCRASLFVIPVLVPGIHCATDSGASGVMDPGNTCRDDIECVARHSLIPHCLRARSQSTFAAQTLSSRCSSGRVLICNP